MLRGHEQRFGDTTRQQILALGRLGWTLSRIQQMTGIRRETIRGYLKAAGMHRIADVDRPRRTPPKTVALLEAAMRIGPSVSTIAAPAGRQEKACRR